MINIFTKWEAITAKSIDFENRKNRTKITTGELALKGNFQIMVGFLKVRRPIKTNHIYLDTLMITEHVST